MQLLFVPDCYYDEASKETRYNKSSKVDKCFYGLQSPIAVSLIVDGHLSE